MAVLTLPTSSKAVVASSLVVQALALSSVVSRTHRSIWLSLVAFFLAGFLTDLISGLAHFSFDYVWRDETPITGPISVEFREHHVDPTLDPSAFVSNLTRGAYGAIPFALATWIVARVTADTALSFLVLAVLMGISLWMLGFHQIHSYAHMGSTLSPEEFNRAVVEISQLRDKRQQKKEFARLFESVGIPRFVRLLQRAGLFLRPELHWQHHISFESDFSSVNGWSDPFMNWFYGPVARRKKAERLALLGTDPAQPTSTA